MRERDFPLQVPSELRRNSTSSMGRVCANLGAHPHLSLLHSLTQHTTMTMGFQPPARDISSYTAK